MLQEGGTPIRRVLIKRKCRQTCAVRTDAEPVSGRQKGGYLRHRGCPLSQVCEMRSALRVSEAVASSSCTELTDPKHRWSLQLLSKDFFFFLHLISFDFLCLRVKKNFTNYTVMVCVHGCTSVHVWSEDTVVESHLSVHHHMSPGLPACRTTTSTSWALTGPSRFSLPS